MLSSIFHPLFLLLTTNVLLLTESQYSNSRQNYPYNNGAQRQNTDRGVYQQRGSVQERNGQKNKVSQRNGQYDTGRAPINQPLVNTFPATDNSDQNTTGALIALQLLSFSNPSLSLSPSTTCACPLHAICPYLKTKRPDCWFSFTTIVSAPDQTVQFVATEFVPLKPDGSLDLTISTVNWTKPITFYLSSKPSAIDIFVQHHGPVIDKTSGALIDFDTIVHVDTFVQSLNNYVPSVTNSRPMMQSVHLVGKKLATTLRIAYSVQCRNNYIGPKCDLSCDSVKDGQYLCKSSQTQFYAVCKRQSDGQMDDCQVCYNGLYSNNGTCRPVIATYQQQSNGFRTWTIVLGCLAGVLLLLLLIVLLVCLCIVGGKRRRQYRSNDTNADNMLINESSEQRKGVMLSTEPYNRMTKTTDTNANQQWGFNSQRNVAALTDQQQKRAPLANINDTSMQSDDASHTSFGTRNNNGQQRSRAYRREAQV